MTNLPPVIRKGLARNQADGQWVGGRIEIDSTIRNRRELEILLHEALHWMCPYMAEEEVVRVASGASRLAWRDGYRRREQPRESNNV